MSDSGFEARTRALRYLARAVSSAFTAFILIFVIGGIVDQIPDAVAACVSRAAGGAVEAQRRAAACARAKAAHTAGRASSIARGGGQRRPGPLSGIQQRSEYNECWAIAASTDPAATRRAEISASRSARRAPRSALRCMLYKARIDENHVVSVSHHRASTRHHRTLRVYMPT